MHAMKGPAHERSSKEKKKKSHQDSEIKEDTIEKEAHWTVSKRLEELQKVTWEKGGRTAWQNSKSRHLGKGPSSGL